VKLVKTLNLVSYVSLEITNLLVYSGGSVRTMNVAGLG
jgi:hypothetical protein